MCSARLLTRIVLISASLSAGWCHSCSPQQRLLRCAGSHPQRSHGWLQREMHGTKQRLHLLQDIHRGCQNGAFLVAQCSATPATVAATPPCSATCSATPFQTQISVRHLPGQGAGQGATPKFLGGVARHRCYTCKML